MSTRSSTLWRSLSVVIAALIVVFALPQQWRSSLPGPLGSADFRLGLDLAGGTQLDFRISEAEMADQEASIHKQLADAKAAGTDTNLINSLELDLQVLALQRQNLVEAIRTVLERRINSLGVSEATITPSYVGDEKHLLVECPGVVDVQQCIATVGKTIQLEFKEEQTEATPAYAAEVRAKAAGAERQLQTKQATLEKLGQDFGTQLGVLYDPGTWYMRDSLPKGLQALWNGTPGSVRRFEGALQQQAVDESGKVVTRDLPGIFLAELLSPRTQTGRVLNEASAAFATLALQEQNVSVGNVDRVDLSTLPVKVQAVVEGLQPGQLSTATLDDGSAQVLFVRGLEKGRELVDVSHILIAYKGASGTDVSVTRTKEEASTLAQELKSQIDAGGDFNTLARQSDAPSKSTGGKLDPIARGVMPLPFEKAAFALKQGAVSEIVETDFGFHIIRSDKAPYVSPSVVSLDTLTVKGDGAPARAAALVGRMQRGEVTRMEDAIQVRFLYFSLQPVGWKDTQLDGKHFRTAGTIADPTTGLPVVQISFDAEGGRLFQELTRRNIGKKLAIFVGGQLVSSPTVQGEISGGTAVITGSQSFTEAQQLAQDLNTGAIPAPIYLAGQRTVEPTLGSEALRTSLNAGVIGAIVVMLFLIVVYRLLGVLASLSLLAYSAIFLALLKLPLFLITDQYVVLTLAGVAGMILSIGLAVDANVLIFERLKEELYRGRGFKQAVELGFERAWPSIRDSNISTLITCAILFMFGTSIVRGFAVTLSVGVLISLFTGLVLTRAMARLIGKTKLANDTRWFVWGKAKSQ